MAIGTRVPDKAFMAAAFGVAMAASSIERTLILVKPDGVRRGLMGEVLSRLERKGFTVVAARLLTLDRTTAEAHYAEHRGKPFFAEVVRYITSAPVLALAVEGRSAIATIRSMVGATDPLKAAPGTIRGDLALALSSNIIHASDSPTSASRELALFFQPGDYVTYSRAGSEYF